MNRKLAVIVIVCAAVAICLSAVSLVFALGNCSAKEKPDVQYVLYVGTNDKDTNLPVFTPDQAKEKAKEILIGRFGGYTIQEADGGWIDDNGTIYQEYSIVIHLSDTTADQVHSVCDELLKEFNQSSILIHENRTTAEFYSGK